MRPHHTVRLACVALALLVAVARADEPVQVFVLAGQSNMVGAGQVKANPDRNGGEGSLEWLAESSPDRAKYGGLRDGSGRWVERDDVKIWFLGRKGGLRPGFGSNEGTIGPELGFGHVVGDALDAPVLLVKIAWGGKSIGRDFRPPSSGGEVGPEYKKLVELTKQVLAEAGELFPEFAGRDFRLAGVGWHQGWNDRIDQAFNEAYEGNLSNLIRDLRRDLGEPSLPFVIAETGMSGLEEKHPRALSLMAAQKAVAERPEFRGSVAFVGTRAFYRAPEHSPSGQQYHWNSNAETYYLIGESMGKAMLELCRDGGKEAGSAEPSVPRSDPEEGGAAPANDPPPLPRSPPSRQQARARTHRHQRASSSSCGRKTAGGIEPSERGARL